MVPYALQLCMLGLVWVSFHCAGMCGPIVASLNAGLEGDDGDSSGAWRRGAANVLAYQAGRAVVYACFGAAAGWLGGALEALVQTVSRGAVLVVAPVLVAAGLLRLPPIRRRLRSEEDDAAPGAISRAGRALGRAGRKLGRLAPDTGRLRLVVFGGVMGFLPCMLMFWVLGLAASTGHPLHGAGLMIGLVAMTTPVLLLAGTSPLLARGAWQRHGEWVTSLAVACSGIWLGLIGMAANGWIAHLRVELSLAGRTFPVMFW